MNMTKSSFFPARLSHVRSMHFFEHALNLPVNSCVEIFVEDNMVHVSEPLSDKTTIDLGTHIGFLHACRVDDWPDYHTHADGRIEIQSDVNGKGDFFEQGYIVDRDEIWMVIENVLDEDRLHDAHIIMNKIRQLKDKIGVPREPDIVAKFSQSIQTITASDLMHLAMSTDKMFCAPVSIDPHNRSIVTIGHYLAGYVSDNQFDLSVVMNRMGKSENDVVASDENEQQHDKVANDVKDIFNQNELSIGYLDGCNIDDWPGFKMLPDDMVSHNGLKMPISQAYKEICKSNPDCEANRIMKTIEEIRQACGLTSSDQNNPNKKE